MSPTLPWWLLIALLLGVGICFNLYRKRRRKLEEGRRRKYEEVRKHRTELYRASAQTMKHIREWIESGKPCAGKEYEKLIHVAIGAFGMLLDTVPPEEKEQYKDALCDLERLLEVDQPLEP